MTLSFPINSRTLREKGLWPLIFFLAGAGIRLAYLFSIQGDPYLETLAVDAMSYHRKALAILANGPVFPHAFYQDPLYPYFLALVYKAFSATAFPVLAVQAVLGGINAALVFLMGRFSEESGRESSLESSFFSMAHMFFTTASSARKAWGFSWSACFFPCFSRPRNRPAPPGGFSPAFFWEPAPFSGETCF